MEFSKRIAVLASVATWGCVLTGVVAAFLTAWFVPGASVDMVQVWAWTAFGAGLAATTTVLAFQAQRARRSLQQTVRVGRLILVANVVYITGLACASGGLLGCASVLLAVTVLFSSLLFWRWSLALFALLLSVSVAFTGTLTQTWTGSALPLGLVALVALPAMALIGGQVYASVFAFESESSRERAELTARVDALTGQLSRAAAGDLSTRVDVSDMVEDGADDDTVVVLSQSVNEALESLRTLVEQVRAGGEQIQASAGELLATAEEHAASATQQSSAVAETTSTIEELAATAAQIADTAEAVARYAAETLRHAEEGRRAVSASVALDGSDRRPGRLDRVPRALPRGEEPGDRSHPRRHRRPGRPDQPARAQRGHRGRACG